MAPSPKEPLFLGLDLSTQQLKAIIISQDCVVLHESAVHFDNDLPGYGTTNGAIRGPGEGEVKSPVAMWLQSIDLLMVRMKDAGVSFNSISAISGAGQVRLAYPIHILRLFIVNHSNMDLSTGQIKRKTYFHPWILPRP